MRGKLDFHLICRLALGLVFIISALLKLKSADAFGTYIYGLDLLSLELSAVAARLLIGFEFSLGVLLIMRLYRRFVDGMAFFSLLAFSVFLLVLLLKGDDGNCYCFGNAIELSPGESLLKNAIFFLLLHFGSKTEQKEWSWAKIFVPSLFLVSVALCFALRWPDVFSSNRTVEYDEDAFLEYVEKADLQADVMSGRRMVAFVSTSCSHCRLLTRKVDATLSRLGMSDSSVLWVVYDPKRIYDDVLATGEFRAPNARFLDGRILSITEGVLPLLLLMRDGEVVDKMSNRTFSEERLVEFLQK